MTGYDDAVAWLRANAPKWLLARSDSRLAAGPVAGSPTETRYEVVLVETDALLHESLGSGYVQLHGEGTSMVEAVQNAVGGAR